MEQSYVDKFASIDEKIRYKNNKTSWPYRVNLSINKYPDILDCGHSDMYIAYKCHKLQLIDRVLTYTYKAYKGGIETGKPTFKEITKSIDV